MNQEDNQSQDSINEKQIENNLKDLLERILLNADKFIDTKEELNQIEGQLKDYENLSHLIGIIKAVFTNMMMKVEKKMSKLEKQIDPNYSQTYSMRTDEEYDKLEQTMIKYEVEIRNHIRVEQQLKLYAESIQTKLDESEMNRTELLNTTKQLISNLKRENQTYHEVQQKLKNEIIHLKQIISGLEKENRRKSLDLSQRDQLKLQCKANQQSISQSYQLQKQNHEKSFQEYKGNIKQSQKCITTTDNNEIPINSQQSLKQNYYNIIHQGNIANKAEIQKVTQQKEIYRGYGQRLKSKNNSLSNIQDVIQSVSVQDRKKVLNSQTISKNSSQDNSQVIKFKESGDLSRSKSSRRANLGQKLIIVESQIKLTC
ncbi:unnamed protein product [Paramecium pentaurelia]|uniref:Uncharacterized protein n=1 Tax=Paramecium pentaurelia TaxID=43138 RepID=A0A8S1S1B1_9CILI|nr:unnamed protein product [Paramecium pentaurelia]